jgi:hypothetical protein
MQDTDRLLTVRETADLLRVVPLTLARWRKKAEGPDYSRVGQRILYRKSVVEAWIAAQASSAKVSV